MLGNNNNYTSDYNVVIIYNIYSCDMIVSN